jgi:hypothetical protein
LKEPEFGVLGEAFDSGILCNYAKAGVKVDMVVELHKKEVCVCDDFSQVDEYPSAFFSSSCFFTFHSADSKVTTFDQVVVPGLKECGVTIFNGNGVGEMR